MTLEHSNMGQRLCDPTRLRVDVEFGDGNPSHVSGFVDCLERGLTVSEIKTAIQEMPEAESVVVVSVAIANEQIDADAMQMVARVTARGPIEIEDIESRLSAKADRKKTLIQTSTATLVGQPRSIASSERPDRSHSSSELIVGALWRSTLGLESVGLHVRFDEVGGDSFTALRIFMGLKQHYPYASISDLFEHPTIASLAAALDQTTAANPSVERISVVEL